MSLIPPVPQEASMIVAGGVAMAFHYGSCFYCKRRCDPGQIVLFAGSAVAVVAGVYVFFEALDASLSPRTAPAGMTNAVWASIGGLAVAFFALDVIFNEIRRIFTKPA